MRRDSSVARTKERMHIMRGMANKGGRSQLCPRCLTSKSLILKVRKAKKIQQSTPKKELANTSQYHNNKFKCK